MNVFNSFFQEKKKQSLLTEEKLLPLFYTAYLNGHNIQLIFFPWGLEHLQMCANYRNDGTILASYIFVDGRVIQIPNDLYRTEQFRQQAIWCTIKQGLQQKNNLQQLETFDSKLNPILKSYSIPEDNSFGAYTMHLTHYRKTFFELEKQKNWLKECAKEKEVATSFQYKLPFAK